MSRNILDHSNEFAFIHMLFFMQAAQASTALPVRYERLGFEFGTASKKINLCKWFFRRKNLESTHL